MSMRDDFLEEIREGDYVLIVTEQMTVTGTVIRLTSGMVRVQTEDGSPRIALDSIVSYDTPDPAKMPPAAPAATEPAAAPAEPGEQPRPAVTMVETLTQQLKSAVPMSADDVANWKALSGGSYLRERYDDLPNVSELQKEWNSVISQVANMRKNPPPTTEREEKMHNLKARVLRMRVHTPELEEAVCWLVASISFQMGDYVDAEKYFASCDPLGAFYAAEKSGSEEKRIGYMEQHILEDDFTDAYVYRAYALGACGRKNAAALSRRFLREKQQPDAMSAEDWRCMLACACVIAREGGLPLQWVEAYDGTPAAAIAGLERFFGLLPADWERARVAEAPAVAAATSQPTVKEYVGSILSYLPAKRVGFITTVYGNHHFYIEQVNNEDPLRRMLATGKEAYDNLEVRFRLGKPYDPTKPPSAYNIWLTGRGAQEAQRRLERREREIHSLTEVREGDLMEYDRNIGDGFGHVYVGDTAYNVTRSGIVDPALVAYLCLNFKYDIRVRFSPMEHKGKRIATHVRLADDSYSCSEYELRQLLRDGDLKQEELDRWEVLRQQLENPPEPEEPEDLYTTFRFVALEPVEGEIVKEQPPVEEAQPVAEPVPAVKPVTVRSGSLPALEPLPDAKPNRFLSLTPLTGMYCDDAIRLADQGRLREAEEQFINAIRAGDRVDSAVANLVSKVYLREADRVPDAINLMEAYGHLFTTEKKRNLMVQIYGKRQERPYRIALCHQLEAGLEQPLKANTRLHYLTLLGNTLHLLGEYEAALGYFRRWHQAYEAEVQINGQSAARKYSGQRNGVRQMEAVCHYRLGDMARAQELARELLRVSSADEIARQILSGALAQETPIGSGSDLITYEEDDVPQENSYSTFASNRLQDTRLSQYLKTTAVVNDMYEGNIRQAAGDIEFLSNAPGKTPALRSAHLLCMAKISASVRERFGTEPSMAEQLKKNQLTEKRERSYVARSMAAYGDFLMQEQQAQDTARYAYLHAIKGLGPEETDHVKSINHYLLSYFNGQQDTAQIVRTNNSTSKPQPLDLSVITQKQPLDIGEFLLGMLRLRQAVGFNRRMELAEKLRRCAAIDAMEEWLDKSDIRLSVGGDAFDGTLRQADEYLKETEQRLALLLEELPDRFFSRINSEELLGSLRDGEFRRWLNYTDRSRLEEICRILSEFRSYFNTREFSQRSNTLSNAAQRIANLMKAIREYPTGLSNDVYLPVLELTQARLQMETERHYADLPPEITLSFTEGIRSYLGQSSEVNVHITARNGSAQSKGEERQMADNISLSVASLSPGVEFRRFDTQLSDSIYGGKTAEAILVFRILDEQILSMGSFDLKLQCSYQYYERPAEMRTAEIEFGDSVVFQQGLSAHIENPFRGHIGNEMKDEAMFMGRDDILERLLAAMRTEHSFNYGHGTLLFGQTRAGKSSIRVHLKNRVRARYPEVIQVDMGNLNGSLDMFSLYSGILSKLESELKENHPDILQLMEENEVEIPGQDVLLQRPEVAPARFNRFMDRLQTIIRPRGRMILLLADEFSAVNSAIQAGTLPEDFMQTWKALLENYGIFAVCFGQDDTPIFANRYQNAFARMAQEKVTYLEEEPAKALMDQPIAIPQSDGTFRSRYTTGVLEELYLLTAGSAYLIMILCSNLVDYLNAKGAGMVTPGILQNFLDTRVFGSNSVFTENDFEPQIGDRSNAALAPINRRLLLDIARNSQINGWAEISSLTLSGLEEREGQQPAQRLNELLQRLRERDVIEIAEERRCRIRVALLTGWLLARYGRT